MVKISKDIFNGEVDPIPENHAMNTRRRVEIKPHIFITRLWMEVSGRLCANVALPPGIKSLATIGQDEADSTLEAL
jgi:hypothetical protein